MDENAVRDLLELVASDQAPPSLVSTDRARAAGRRRRRLVRVYLPGAAPVAAAVAVALIAGLSAHLSSTASTRQRPAVNSQQHKEASVPTKFSALTPYASFGWLPAGFSAAGVANGFSQSSTTLTATASAPLADGRTVMLRVNAAGSCRTTPAAAFKKYARYRLSQLLVCPGFNPPLGKRAPDIDGSPAYWTFPQGGLAWEYGRDAWATLVPMPNPAVCVHCSAHPTLAGWYGGLARSGHPAVAQSRSARQLLLRIAAGVRFGTSPAVGYGFTLTGLPGNWRPDRSGNSVSFAILAGRLVNVGWSAGPADDPTALGIMVTPARGSDFRCNFVAGQSSYVTLGGARMMVRVIDLPGKHVQYLCDADLRGLALYISLDQNVPGTSARPLPGAAAVGSVEKVFRHLQLLGPDVADWTTRQPG